MGEPRILLCQRCRRMFKSLAYTDLCPSCERKREELFWKVKKYIRKNEKANILDVCETFEIDEKQVIRWVRQERLYFSEKSGVIFNCLKCGIPIRTGQYCSSCKEVLVKRIKANISNNMAPLPKETRGTGMHYIKKKK